VFGIDTRSSGFWTPQTKVSPPDGAQDVWADPMDCHPATAIPAISAAIRNCFIVVSPMPVAVYAAVERRLSG
jgi:hypothetical protein